MSLQLPAILSPPTPCIPSPALTVSPLEEVAEVALPFTGRRPVLAFAHPTQARQCIRPYRVQHCFIYGLAVRLWLPPTPSLDDAVTMCQWAKATAAEPSPKSSPTDLSNRAFAK